MSGLAGMLKNVVRVVVVGLALFFAVGALQGAGVQLPTSLADLQHPEQLFSTSPEHSGADAVPSSDPDNYSFLSTSDSGEPARYNPCAPIRYTVNAANALPGAVEDTQAAFAQISAATGLTFEFVGETDAVPTSKWYKHGDGSAYPPIAIAWVAPGQTDLLTTVGASGNGGSDFLQTSAGPEFITGTVVLNTEHNDMYAPGFGSGATRGNLLLHEIGHVVGLGHAHEPGAIMYGEVGASTPNGYAAGDLNGLSQLGTAKSCMPVLTR